MAINDRPAIGTQNATQGEPAQEGGSIVADDALSISDGDHDVEDYGSDSDSDSAESTAKLDLLATAVHVNNFEDTPSDFSIEDESLEPSLDVQATHTQLTEYTTTKKEAVEGVVNKDDIIREQEVVMDKYFETFETYQCNVRSRQCCIKSLRTLKNMKRCAKSSDDCTITNAIGGIPSFLKASLMSSKTPMYMVKELSSDLLSDTASAASTASDTIHMTEPVSKAKRMSSGVMKCAASSGKDLLSFTAKTGKSIVHHTKATGKDITEASIDKIQDAIALIHTDSKGSLSDSKANPSTAYDPSKENKGQAQQTVPVQESQAPIRTTKCERIRSKANKPAKYAVDVVLAEDAVTNTVVDVDQLSSTSSEASLSDSSSLPAESTEIDYPTEYDPELVELLVRYTTSAYCPLHSGSCVVCGCDESLPPDFEATKRVSDVKYDASGFVGVQSDDRNLIICSFRGTKSKTNWGNNFKAVYWSARSVGFDEAPRDAFVHLGFWNTFASIADEALEEVVRLKGLYPDHLVCVTGHSLGGALATYCALKLALIGIEVAGYTFGQPRTGNGKWAAYFDKHVPHFFRIVNNYDVVPHLPVRATGYTHIGKQLWFTYQIKGKEAKLIKTNQNNVHLTDKMNRSELKVKPLNGVPFYKLNIVDHLVYFERVTGRAKVCKPGTEEALPKRKYGPVTLFEKSFCDFISNPQHSTLLLVYTCPAQSPAWKQHPGRKRLRELDKRYRHEKQNLLFAEINTARETVPPMFRIEDVEYDSVVGGSGTVVSDDVMSRYSRLWLVHNKEGRLNEKCAKVVEYEPKHAVNFCEKHVKACKKKVVNFREELVWKTGQSCHKLAHRSSRSRDSDKMHDSVQEIDV
ncbi:hypothetical protein SARC_03925 [Sphaeroforma arctica JP610]|uniref:Fungal lipase-type domain-containing protein n=1 Tax=Sphaeroforma arctica JP610 TaxID=667725 RepID=A0A0L0G6I5_9EUKA|nr:hypothetical protein SARC_03925 [Sphaeroforma arctica JP610]KNC83843.1 hypothetical protein SARC_03925 [Sphaeroforma arctica JP610]|eukprot:XP_014157745.1 hypothetical protein SARC_03925 [Sphaeroforma arctica JP610]